MPTFALPLAPSTTTTHAQPNSSRVRFSNLPIRKRKRPAPSSPENSSPEASNNEADDSENGGLPESTNPLSLTPAEIAQYKLAGLRLDEELPAVEGFPHRGLPRKYTLKSETVAKSKKGKKGKGKAREESLGESEELDEESEKEVQEPRKGASTGPQLRLQHLAVLTAILQRCLLEGDIDRAKRAWAMLIRGQFGGKGVDLRQSGYWGIGAELLMRSLDKPGKRPSYDSNSEDEEEEDGERRREEGGWRWGTKEGLEKTKDYYERLILQHPYKRHFHGSVNALDFWPAMVGCEIYGIQAEQKQSLRKLEKDADEDDGGERSGSESEASAEEDEEDTANGGYAADQRRKDRRMNRRAERRWVERDEIRRTALAAAEKIAARLDELMGTPPFSDSHNMLRLRGMLALYIGDFSVPAKPIEDDDEEEEQSLRRSQRLSRGGRDTKRRFLFRERMNDHERGKKKQAEEQEKARKIFDRIAKGGGSLEDIKYLSLAQDQEVHDAEE
ncbi:uncharacterized protein PAC_12220 [Phialocephala subalpina]|uniref:Uncharacterized protein n=1 Tax=Phialocephala subalpina TaxID=576137 RepID=A0A1L7XBC7_9HELO|nr:uncharacterized protein PAC_12220 [Phialocephala subalpina]